MKTKNGSSYDSFAARLLAMRSWGHARRRSAPKRTGCSPVESLESRVLLTGSPTPEMLVNSTTAGAQRTHTEGGRSLDTAADGSYVVVWHGAVPEGSSTEIIGQRYDSEGAPIGGEFVVNETWTNTQSNAAVAVRDDGSFVVTWQSRLQDGTDFGIYARTYAADGTPTSGEIAINQTTLGNQQLPVVAVLEGVVAEGFVEVGGGGFAIAWNGRGPGDPNGIFARVFDASGNAVTDEFAVNTTTNFAQSYATVAADSDGGFAVSWHGNGGSDRKNVMFRHFAGDGSPISEEVVVNQTQAGIQKTPSIAQTSDGNFIVAWSGNGEGDNDGIFARRIGVEGEALGDEILVNADTADKQTTPSVIGTDDNGFAVSWADQSSPGPNANFEIAAREFTGSDTPLSGDVIVNSTFPGRQWSPTIAYSGGNLLLSWSGKGVGDSFGVFTSWLLPDEIATSILG